MCGIFGYIGNKTNAAKIVLEGLKRLEYRGYDSWGIAEVPSAKFTNKYQSDQSFGKLRTSFTNPSTKFIPSKPVLSEIEGVEGLRINKIIVKKKIGKIGKANVDNLPASTLAFGHTRWATHGGVTEINAHPHLDCTGKIAVIHNGIFENYEEIKKKLIKQGHRFISETDTEIIAHLVEEFKKNHDFSQAVRLTFNKMAGLNAIIVIDADHKQLIATRNGSPLVVGFGQQENFLASDAAALLPHTKDVYFLKDEEMAILSGDAIRVFDTKTDQPATVKKQTLNWTVAQAEKGKYDYFMLKEIYEQPGIITNIAITATGQALKMAGLIKSSYGTYLVGCGSMSYTSLAGSYLFSKIAQRHVNWAVGSEFGYQLEFLTPKSLVMALSQSGETMDILESVKKAKSRGAKILALVNVLGSTLYREADYKMLANAGPEKSVASTKDVTAKLAHLTLLAYALAGKIKEGQNTVMLAAKASKKILSTNSIDRLKKLAKKIHQAKNIYVIGRGLSYPASLETAMKIKEISYIHGEGLAAGELKHGPLALIDKGTPCIAYLPRDETYGANLAGAMEMKARGGYVIGVSFKPHEVFDYFIPVQDAREATIIPNIIVGQLLAYYLTLEKGLDPDMPRNLAKSVTVK